MHIAQFIQRYPPALGGSEAYAARLTHSLTRCGDQVSVWTSTAVELEQMWRGQPSTDEPHQHSHVTVRRYPPLTFPGRRYVLKAMSLLPVRAWQCATMPCNPICPAMWHEAGKYDGPLDAVHATAFPYAFPLLCGLRLARRHGVPFLLTPFLHLGDPDNAKDRTRRQYTAPHLQWLLQQADRVIVQTRLERDAAAAMGVRLERIVLQGLGVEPRECTGGDRDATRQAWGVAPDEVAIGHLANNSPEKGTVDLLQAAERCWTNGQRLRVVLAGPEMPAFRKYFERFTRRDRVVRLGVLSDAQKRDFFAGIDAFALPSRSDSFGLVLLEAWANRKPNLVYRAGGPAELVRDGIDGFHARCGNVVELAQQLGHLVAEAPLRRRLGDAGHARITSEFRWEDKLMKFRNVVLTCREHEQKFCARVHHSAAMTAPSASH